MSQPNLLALPLEISLEILSHLQINDVWHWACASRHAQKIAQVALHQRFRQVVAPFVRAASFGMVLKENEAVISGLVALQFAEGPTNWQPTKMDVYAPFSTFSTIVQYLIGVEKYEEYSESGGDTHPVANANAGGMETVEENEDEEGSLRVVTVRKGNLRVDVTCSSTDAALYPISFLGCTTAVNYLGMDQFGCAYPAFTLRRRCLECCPGREKTAVLMAQYEKIGYRICSLRYVCMRS